MTHFVAGSGSFGCLYDNGPDSFPTKEDAIASLRQLFDDGDEDGLTAKELDAMENDLRTHGIHRFPRSRAGIAGADYCEVSEMPGECPEEGED